MLLHLRRYACVCERIHVWFMCSFVHLRVSVFVCVCVPVCLVACVFLYVSACVCDCLFVCVAIS